MRTLALTSLLLVTGCFHAKSEPLLMPKDAGPGGGGGTNGGGVGGGGGGVGGGDALGGGVGGGGAAGGGDGGTFSSELAAGADHACEVRSGELWCWGANTTGQLGLGTQSAAATPTRVGAESSWAHVTAGTDFTCAVRTDGALYCWGSDLQGQLGDGASQAQSSPEAVPGNWAQVSAGGWTACAVKSDATLFCWGHNWYGKLGDGSGIDVQSRATPGQVTGQWSQVAVSDYHVCGIQTDGSLWCWGEGRFGELGDGTTDHHFTPSRVGTDNDWASVNVSAYVTCAFKQSGAEFCFGSNWLGRYGNGQQTVGEYTATLVPDHGPWRVFSAGDAATCGIHADGTLWCWGYNAQGEVGDGTLTSRFAPVQIGSANTWASVACGGRFTCATQQDGTRWCWGDRSQGQTGQLLSSAPADVGGNQWAATTAGFNISFGLRTDGTLFSWGLALDGSGVSQTPVELLPGLLWSRVSAFASHACLVKSDGTLWCLGANGSGQLGYGGMSSSSSIGEVSAPGANWLDVSVGGQHTCGIQSDGSLWCWGEDSSHQLGDGLMAANPMPAQIGTASWSSVSAGQQHTCGIQTGGTLWCWGSNQGGRAGLGPDGQVQQAPTPQQVGSATWLSVSAGQLHTCAIRSDHTLWCFGINANGQLGDGSQQTQFTPEQIGSATDWSSVSANGYTCGVEGGALFCWGPEVPEMDVPTRIGTASNWSSARVGWAHVCATAQDGTLWCFGRNDEGERGDGSAWSSSPQPL